MNILLGLIGSVAVIKANKLYERLIEIGEVKVVATKSAIKMLKTKESDWQSETHIFKDEDKSESSA